MPPPRNREKQVLIALGAAALIGLTWSSWQVLGSLGVALLGLLVLFVAVRIELEGNRPVGTQSTPEFYASHFRAEAQQQQHAERASRRAETAAYLSTARLFAIAGALLTTTGFSLLYFGLGQQELSALFWVFADASITLFQKGKSW